MKKTIALLMGILMVLGATSALAVQISADQRKTTMVNLCEKDEFGVCMKGLKAITGDVIEGFKRLQNRVKVYYADGHARIKNRGSNTEIFLSTNHLNRTAVYSVWLGDNLVHEGTLGGLRSNTYVMQDLFKIPALVGSFEFKIMRGSTIVLSEE